MTCVSWNALGSLEERVKEVDLFRKKSAKEMA